VWGEEDGRQKGKVASSGSKGAREQGSKGAREQGSKAKAAREQGSKLWQQAKACKCSKPKAAQQAKGSTASQRQQVQCPSDVLVGSKCNARAVYSVDLGSSVYLLVLCILIQIWI
jgi:hypothetical protein